MSFVSSRRSRSRTRVLAAGLASALVSALALPLSSALPASAAPAPAVVPSQPTVTADALPTVQVNGVVWAQVVVGSTVYATGEFTSARPAGAAAGTNETPRSNLLAYDLATGVLKTSWAPSLNGTGLAITASPDGSRIYVGGTFTAVSGLSRYRVVALDAATGAVVRTFAPNLNARVRTLAVVGGALYVGGNFTAANGQARTRLAAYSTADGALLPWAPSADQEPYAMTAPAGTAELVVGGRFSTLNDEAHLGMGALDLTTGTTLPWAATDVIQNYGPNSAIYSLSSDGTSVYGTAYDFYGPSDFENAFAADPAGGAVRWVNGCFGDTYSNVPLGGVLYTAGHAHDCSAIGGHPDTSPRTFQRAQAFATAGGSTNTKGVFAGRPAAEILPWLPTLTAGSYTGQTQAAWSVAGNASYVVLGGEFPKVNGTAQQGLVRFAVRSLAPGREGPQGYSELTPSLVSLAPGTARAAVRAAWDRDDRSLRYELLRGATASKATAVATTTSDSSWWDRPGLVLTDPAAPAGTTQTYRVRVTDPSGNAVTGTASTVAISSETAPSAYRDAVLADGAQDYWRLGEASGTTAYDWAGADDLTLDASAARGQAGATPDGDSATGFTGSAAVPATTTSRRTAPDTFSVEAWIRTTTTSGGKVIGYGDSATGSSSNYDRHVYMRDDGRLVFGVYTGGTRTTTSAEPYNDGQWHHVVATLGSAGEALYVDGARVARDASVTSGQPFSGYWRVGGDNLGGWPGQPSSSSFAGAVDDVAVYGSALDLSTVQSHYRASGRTLSVPVRPTDAYGAAVWDSQPDSFWRLEGTSGTVAADSGPGGVDGTLQGGAVPGAAGVLGTRGVALDGVDDTIVSTVAVPGPHQYSAELWFSTTSTSGGKLVGFGSSSSGRSGSYDRHVTMYGDGRLSFGTWTGRTNTADSTASYNDGAWHHLVATQGPAGMVLYVDGWAVATNPETGAQDYTGYWRVGGDTTWGGTSSDWLTGSVDEVAVYSTALSAAAVADHSAKGRPAPANQAPTAAFTATAEDLAASFDASASADADGSVKGYAWDFGDGSTGTGATAQHTYTAAGTHPVVLTVTDDAGATGSVRHDVTVSAPAPVPAPAVGVLAQDAFARTVTGGFGTADTGGAWTPASGASSFSVAGGAGLVQLAAGSTRTTSLDAVSSTSTDLRVSVALDKAATGSGTYVSVVGRRAGSTTDYRVKVKVTPTGAVTATLVRVVAGAETALGSTAVPGVTYAAGSQLQVRLQVTGTSPTALSAKVWAAGSAEPAAWQVSATDSTAALQVPGGVGLAAYLSGTSTNAPVTVAFRDLLATGAAR